LNIALPVDSEQNSNLGRDSLFPEIVPYKSFLLRVSDDHELYITLSGNPDGQPVLIMHGGPGGSISETSRRYLDPELTHIIQMDQRGCGRSTAAERFENNTTHHLLSDMEALRVHLGVEDWHLMGASWGSTLCLLYAINNPHRVRSLMLQGIFMMTQEEMRHSYQGGIADIWPDAWEKFLFALPAKMRKMPLIGYTQLVFSEDRSVAIPAARAFCDWNLKLVTLHENDWGQYTTDDEALAMAQAELHYFFHRGFLDPNKPGENIFTSAPALSNIPTTIIQGRYDVMCLPRTAWALHKRIERSMLHWVHNAGHAGSEALTQAMSLHYQENMRVYEIARSHLN
jgi:proline iminopeptidase